MNPNLKWKAVLIVLVVVGCLIGLFFVPAFPRSFAQLKENFAHQIQLGLDLQGGTHLILQVQVQEAIQQDTEQTADRLTNDLRSKNIRYDEVRPVDATHILVRNIAPEQFSDFRDLVNARLQGIWDMAPAAGERSSYLLTERPSVIAAKQDQIMNQSLDTIERRINALGLTEPTIQKHGRGDNEIMVQLPGEGDPARARAVIGRSSRTRNVSIVRGRAGPGCCADNGRSSRRKNTPLLVPPRM